MKDIITQDLLKMKSNVQESTASVMQLLLESTEQTLMLSEELNSSAIAAIESIVESYSSYIDTYLESISELLEQLVSAFDTSKIQLYSSQAFEKIFQNIRHNSCDSYVELNNDTFQLISENVIEIPNDLQISIASKTIRIRTDLFISILAFMVSTIISLIALFSQNDSAEQQMQQQQLQYLEKQNELLYDLLNNISVSDENTLDTLRELHSSLEADLLLTQESLEVLESLESSLGNSSESENNSASIESEKNCKE